MRKRDSKFFKKLSRLQDDLGGMNDVAVAESMLMRLIGVQADGTGDDAALRPRMASWSSPPEAFSAGTGGAPPRSTASWSRTGTGSAPPFGEARA